MASASTDSAAQIKEQMDRILTLVRTFEQIAADPHPFLETYNYDINLAIERLHITAEEAITSIGSQLAPFGIALTTTTNIITEKCRNAQIAMAVLRVYE